MTTTDGPVIDDPSGALRAAGPVRPAVLDWVLVGMLTLLAVLIAVYSTFFLPWYAGMIPVPVSAVIGAALTFWSISACYRLTRSIRAAFAPAAGWLVVSVWLSTSRTFGYGLVIGDWRSMLLLGLGSLAVAVALALCWGEHLAAPGVPVVTSARAPVNP